MDELEEEEDDDEELELEEDELEMPGVDELLELELDELPAVEVDGVTVGMVGVSPQPAKSAATDAAPDNSSRN